MALVPFLRVDIRSASRAEQVDEELHIKVVGHVPAGLPAFEFPVPWSRKLQ